MPAKGYRNPNARSYMLRIRLTLKQQTAYEKSAARAGYKSVSAWARSLMDAAAGAARPAEED